MISGPDVNSHLTLFSGLGTKSLFFSSRIDFFIGNKPSHSFSALSHQAASFASHSLD